MKKFEYLSKIEEFEIKGFIKSSDNYILNKLRTKYGEHLRIFNAGYNISAGRTGAKYGTYDIFGDKVCYYYDISKEKEFVDFLVMKFYKKNPNPGRDIRKVFTRILHAYKLHWLGCRHGGKNRCDVSTKVKLKKEIKRGLIKRMKKEKK